MTMGERIRYLREKNQITQEELGKALGVQKSAIVKYEKGHVENIKRTSIKKMAEIFGVSPVFLMGFDDDEKEKNTAAKEDTLMQAVLDQWGKPAAQALSILNGLNEEGIKKALSLLEDISEVPKYKKEEA